MMNTAQDHLTIADSLNSQVVDTLKVVEKKNDDSKKKVRPLLILHVLFY